MDARIAAVGGLVFAVAFGFFGCSETSEQGSGGSHCIDLTGVVAARMMEQHAVASLPAEAQAELLESLKAPGQLCLSAAAVGVSCNAGGARAPDMRRCCKFSHPPKAIVSDMPSRLVIRTDPAGESRPAVDLALTAIAADLTLDQRCEVPTCEADRAAARPQIQISGSLTNDQSVTEIDLRIDLGHQVELICDLPDIDDGMS